MVTVSAINYVTVHALSRACTSNVAKIAFQCAVRAISPFNSGFSRKAREKHLAFQVGLYSSLITLLHNDLYLFILE